MNYEQLAIEGLAENKKFSNESGNRKLQRPKLAEFIFERYSRQCVFAKELGVSNGTVSKWLYSKATPQTAIIFRFGNHFNLKIHEIADLFDMPVADLPQF